jgi:tRNA pseudouridine38-40 synthase
MNRQKIINAINIHLPENIKIFSIKCVARSFNVKTAVRGRHYEYVFPLSCLSKLPQFKEKSTEHVIETVNSLLQLFQGTKNFHNYTKKLKPTDSQSQRYMIKLETVLEEVGDVKLIKIKLYGQSFLYHQIRKMVGAIIQLLVNGKDQDFILNSFASNKMGIWLAPSHGLLLDMVNSVLF